MSAENNHSSRYDAVKKRAASLERDWLETPYAPGCCNVGKLCRMHLAHHQAVCRAPFERCEICEVQP